MSFKKAAIQGRQLFIHPLPIAFIIAIGINYLTANTINTPKPSTRLLNGYGVIACGLGQIKEERLTLSNGTAIQLQFDNGQSKSQFAEVVTRSKGQVCVIGGEWPKSGFLTSQLKMKVNDSLFSSSEFQPYYLCGSQSHSHSQTKLQYHPNKKPVVAVAKSDEFYESQNNEFVCLGGPQLPYESTKTDDLDAHLFEYYEVIENVLLLK